jgi:hypothetical protein
MNYNVPSNILKPDVPFTVSVEFDMHKSETKISKLLMTLYQKITIKSDNDEYTFTDTNIIFQK